MSKDRRRRLLRLVAAQSAVLKAAQRERDLALLRRNEVAAEAGKIVDALNGDSPLHGHLVGPMAEALGQNALEQNRLDRAHRVAAARCEEQRVRTERLVGKAAEATKDVARKKERQVLEGLSVRPGPR